MRKDYKCQIFAAVVFYCRFLLRFSTAVCYCSLPVDCLGMETCLFTLLYGDTTTTTQQKQHSQSILSSICGKEICTYGNGFRTVYSARYCKSYMQAGVNINSITYHGRVFCLLSYLINSNITLRELLHWHSKPSHTTPCNRFMFTSQTCSELCMLD